jgi:DNA-binding NarL/FixJ family response regulator
MQQTRLVLVDAHDLSRYGMQMILNQAQHVRVEGVFKDLGSATAFLSQNRVHIMLLDDEQPRSLDFGRVIENLREKYPATFIVILSKRLSARYVQRLLRSGAKGFIYKDDRLEDTVLVGIETVRNGDIYLSPKVSALPFLDRLHAPTVDTLNHQDIAVLQLMAQGYSAQEIGEQLNLVRRSVYRIRQRLKNALDVRTVEQIVDAARHQGLLDRKLD